MAAARVAALASAQAQAQAQASGGARRRHLAFVYGTLKRGGHNHGLYLAAAEARGRARFLGEARTVDALPLLLRPERAVPCLVNVAGYPGALRVRGELFEVDDACLAALDLVEGVAAGFYAVASLPVEPSLPPPGAAGAGEGAGAGVGGGGGAPVDALVYVYGPSPARFASADALPASGPVWDLVEASRRGGVAPLECFGPDQQRAYEPPRGGAPLAEALRLVEDA